MNHLLLALAVTSLLGSIPDQGTDSPFETRTALPRLAEPVKILAGGEPIAVAIGHAAPWVMDFDKDGRKDLVVGQFSGGKARIYLNVGTDAKPVFEDFTFLQAGGEVASVPPS